MQIALTGLDGRRTEKKEGNREKEEKEEEETGKRRKRRKMKGHMCGNGWNELEEDSIKIH